MWSTLTLPSLPGSLCPVVVAPDRVLSIELNYVLILNWLVRNRTVFTFKSSSKLFKNVYMYKIDLALNILLWLICHKTKSNQIKTNYFRLPYKIKSPLRVMAKVGFSTFLEYQNLNLVGILLSPEKPGLFLRFVKE